MFPTIVYVITLIGLLLLNFLLWALCLRLGLRWARVMDVTWGRVVLTTALLSVISIAISVLVIYIPPSFETEALAYDIAKLAACLIIPSAVISTVFMVPVLRAFQAWLPTLLVSVAMLAFIDFVMKPYLYESFVAPTNAMAPTLLGNHWRGRCSECGKPAYCTPQDRYFSMPRNAVVICDNFHVANTGDISKKVHSAEHFTTAKFLAPRRWDLITFHLPHNPSE